MAELVGRRQETHGGVNGVGFRSGGVRAAGCTGYRGARRQLLECATAAPSRAGEGVWGVPSLRDLRAMAVEFPVVQKQAELLRAGVLTVDEVRAMRGLAKLGAASIAEEVAE